MVIKDGEAEICLWVGGVDGLFSFGGADHADYGDVGGGCPSIDEFIKGQEGAAAGGDHGIQDDDVGVGSDLGEFLVVEVGLGVLVAMDADKSDGV